MNLDVIYLAVALCFNAACTDQQIFIADSFDRTPSGYADCQTEAGKRRALALAQGVSGVRVACKTQDQLERDGV